MHKEDVDIAWRARLRGWACMFIPEATAKHIRSFRPGSQKRTRVSEYMRLLSLRNRYALMITNDIPSVYLRHAPLIWFYDLGVFVYACLRERTSLKAYRELWKSRDYLRQKRQHVQSNRVASNADMQRWFTS